MTRQLFLTLGILSVLIYHAIAQQKKESEKVSLSKKIVVVIDPGHGGKDPGSPRKTEKYQHEKDIVLNISLKLGDYIKTYIKNVEVIYTRSTDEFISLEERAEIANKHKADYFISIHADSHPNKWVSGPQIHIHNQKLKVSKQLALDVEQELAQRARRKTRGIKDAYQRGYNLYVLQYTEMPGILVEAGCMSNATEMKYLNTDYGQDIIASAIFRAFRTFVKRRHTLEPEDRSTVYRIQICASDKPVPLNHAEFEALGLKVEEIIAKSSAFKYKYVVGREYDRESANRLLSKIKGMGYKDAFVITLDNAALQN